MADSATRACRGCGAAYAVSFRFCPACGQPAPDAPSLPEPDIYRPPTGDGDATGGLIPYKNMPALFAYYCGVFSLIPLFPIGIVAVILGIIGLRAYKRQPAIRGRVHAWIGIILGGLFGLLYLALTVLMIAAAIAAARESGA